MENCNKIFVFVYFIHIGCRYGSHLSHHMSKSEESRWVQDMRFFGCFSTQQGIYVKFLTFFELISSRSTKYK